MLLLSCRKVPCSFVCTLSDTYFANIFPHSWLFIPFLFFLINLFILFIYYFWLCWVFVAARGLSLVAASGGYFRCSARASHCGGFSCCGARALSARVSVVVAHGLSSCGSRAPERRLSSCGAWA